MPSEGAMQRSAEGASNIVAKIPTDVAVGYHLCYGKPAIDQQRDCDVLSPAGRPVDYGASL